MNHTDQCAWDSPVLHRRPGKTVDSPFFRTPTYPDLDELNVLPYTCFFTWQCTFE